MHDFFEQIIRDLADRGFCISSFPDTDLCNELKNEALLRYDEGSFHLASIGKSFRNTTDLSVRSDKIIWIEQNVQKFPSALRYLHFFTYLQNISIVLALQTSVSLNVFMPATLRAVSIKNI